MWKRSYFVSILVLSQWVVHAQNDSLKGGELYSSNFLIDGIQRDFIYYIPQRYGKKDAYPLVIFLHDEGESGKSVVKSYGALMQSLADSSDAIVIYPDAVSGQWNEKTGKRLSATDSINDVGFVSILIDYFRDVYNADAKRVYVCGLFNGGRLAYRLACDIPSKITAVAPFVAEDTGHNCNVDKAVAVMETTGLMDVTKKRVSRERIEEMWQFFMPKKKE